VSRGGHLATITDEAEGAFVTSLAAGLDFWVGAFGKGGAETFTWTTGEPFAFRDFAPGVPVRRAGSECLGAAPDGWRNQNCRDALAYVFEID
jgi:hypothetical protein